MAKKEAVLYGIKTCGTCRKALSWMADEDIPHRYHDLRKDGLDAATLKAWVDEVGWEKLLNRKGLTWKKIPDSKKAGLDKAKATALMLDNPTLIKRPVIDQGGKRTVGFDDAVKKALA
jgi:arsenate reductase